MLPLPSTDNEPNPAEYTSLDVVILCGGLGTRLRNVVNDRPKSMAMVGGRPFLEWWLLRLSYFSCHRVILCIGYMGDCIREYFGDGNRLGLTLMYSEEKQLLGTGGALRQAVDLCESDSTLVLNGDSWCEVDLHQLHAWHEEQKAEGTLLLTHVEDGQRYGQVSVNDDGEIVEFSEKNKKGHGSGWVNAGVYIFRRKLLDSMTLEGTVSLEKDVLPEWVGKGLFGYRGTGEFVDIGLPESYARANGMFKKK